MKKTIKEKGVPKEAIPQPILFWSRVRGLGHIYHSYEAAMKDKNEGEFVVMFALGRSLPPKANKRSTPRVKRK